jgi:hypothetical protein
MPSHWLKLILFRILVNLITKIPETADTSKIVGNTWNTIDEREKLIPLSNIFVN